MTAVRNTWFVITCNTPRCGAYYTGAIGITRAAARKVLRGRGWATGTGGRRDDYCPEHKPVVAPFPHRLDMCPDPDCTSCLACMPHRHQVPAAPA